MNTLPHAVEKLIDEFAKLPGIGPRSAERLAFFVLRQPELTGQSLGNALLELPNGLRYCQICHNLSEAEVCRICESSKRDPSIVAIVEEPLDVVAIEKTGQYEGRYHVLGGTISPLEGIGPDKLHIRDLPSRIEKDGVKELIIATNPSTEGEATAMYIKRMLAETPVQITRLARGLPVGGDLEYADQLTLGRAVLGRQAF